MSIRKVAVGARGEQLGVEVLRGFTCVLTDAGQIYCWGSNDRAQTSRAPVQEDEPQSHMDLQRVEHPVEGAAWKDIAAGVRHACAVDNEGRTYCWGSNEGFLLATELEEFGINADPVEMVNLRNAGVKAQFLSIGVHFNCVLGEEQTAHCWGPLLLLWQFPSDPESAGDAHLFSAGSCAVCTTEGSEDHLWCAGCNRSGVLGNGTTVPFERDRIKLPTIKGVTSFAMGGAHACAVTERGTVWCWGSDLARDASLIGSAVGLLGSGWRRYRPLDMPLPRRVCLPSSTTPAECPTPLGLEVN